MNDVGGALDGIDHERLTTWFVRRIGDVALPLTFEIIHGGRSNLTYLVQDSSDGQWILRRPPLHSVLPSAHDMAREYTVMNALARTKVPVPEMVGYEPATSATENEFFVMEFVNGTVVRDESTARSSLSRHQRVTAARSLVEVLADLHSVEPESVGLGDFGKREDYIQRQLYRWQDQLERGRREYGARPLSILDAVQELLAASVPAQQGSTIVHGDYRLDNVILGPEGEVRAVLDWELATLGDPLADLGMLAVYWSEPGDQMIPLVDSPTVVAGFPRREELIEWYDASSDYDLSQLDYYVAFSCWKLAVILEGVRSRYSSGAQGAPHDRSWESFGDIVVRLGHEAESILDGRGKIFRGYST